MIAAAPLAAHTPLAALAGILVLIAWNMVEPHAIAALLRAGRADAITMLATLLLTVFEDLTYGIVVGVALGAMQFIHRMAQSTSIESGRALLQDDLPDEAPDAREAYDARLAADPDIVIYRISGAFFFGAAATVGAVLDRIADRPKGFIIDLSGAPFVDSTAANTLATAIAKAGRTGAQIYLVGVDSTARQTLTARGLTEPCVAYQPNIAAAVDMIRARVGNPGTGAAASADSDLTDRPRTP